MGGPVDPVPVVSDAFPPPAHVLVDMSVSVDVAAADSVVVSMPVTERVGDGRGRLRAGLVATLVDIAGGALGVRVLRPDWMATADLTVSLSEPPAGPVVAVEAGLVRRGRTTAVVEATIKGGPDGRDYGMGVLTFAVLPTDREPPPMPDLSGESRFVFGDGSRLEAAGGHLLDEIGIATPEHGPVSLDVHPYVHNAFGALQGGMLALLADVAAVRALEPVSPGPGPSATGELSVVDLQIAYLTLARVGPVEARVEPLGADGPRRAAVVHLHDAGAGGRVTTVVQVAAAVLP